MLVDSNTTILHKLLKGDTSLQTSSTPSVPTPTTTLTKYAEQYNNVTLSTESIIHAISTDYLNFYDFTLDQPLDFDGTDELSQDSVNNVLVINNLPPSITYTESTKFSWIYGKTPKFVKRVCYGDDVIEVEVNDGLVSSINGDVHHFPHLYDLLGKRYSEEIFT